MSDWYEVLMIYDVNEEQSQKLADDVRDLLITERVIQPDPTECILGEIGYPPNSRAREMYRNWGKPEENLFLARTNGVEFRAERFINHRGMSEATKSSCPRCGQQFSKNEEVFEAFVTAAKTFYDHGTFSQISCPQCREAVPANEWNVTDLGLCFLAVQFWNWPPFDKPKGKIQLMIESKFGCRVKNSYGRL